MKVVNMGLNTSPYDGDIWSSKVEEIRSAVSKYGVVEVRWECSSKLVHQLLATRLALYVPECLVEIDQESYDCRVKRKN